MSVGRGSPGLLSGRRVWSELVKDSGGIRRPLMDLLPGVEITGWVQQAGMTSTWKARAHYVLAGYLRDVVGVETSLGSLTRAESLPAAGLSAGQFYTNIETASQNYGAAWDDGVTTWDQAGVAWDQYPPLDLYVRMPDSSSPNNSTTVALLGFHFGEGLGRIGEVQPWLGPEKFLNSDFEDGLTSWTGDTAGGGTVTSETGILGSGKKSVKTTGSITAGLGSGPRQNVDIIAGALYQIGGYYYWPSSNPAGLEARLRVGVAGNYLLPDGVSLTAATDGFALDTTHTDEWRSFVLYARAAGSVSAETWIRLYNTTGGALTGTLYVDRMTFRRIYRWVPYDPRLSRQGLPRFETRSQSRIFGGKGVSLGSATILNDPALETALGSLILVNKPAQLSVVGAFGDGEELYRYDGRTQFAGRVQK